MRFLRRSLAAVLLISVAVLAPTLPARAIQASWYERHTLAVICHEQGRCLGSDAPENVKEFLGPIFGRLIRATPLDPTEVGWFVTLEPSPNAWALKHYVGVTAGLLRAGLTRDEMAFVLGHELGHVQFGHFDEKEHELAKYYGIAVISVILTRGQYNPLNDPFYLTAVKIAMASYSRKLESQADAQGLQTMTTAGFDPHASVSALMKIDPMGLARRGDLFDDHPTTLQRVSALQQEMPALPAVTTASHLISPGEGIGQIRIGMEIDEVARILGPAKQEPLDTNGNSLYSWGTQHFFAWAQNDGTVFTLGTSDREYTTRDNLHVGSAEADVRSVLGEPSRVDEDGQFRRLWYDTLGLRFSIFTGSGPMMGTVATIMIYKPR